MYFPHVNCLHIHLVFKVFPHVAFACEEPADKAVKADDSAVPEHLWDDRIITKLMDHWEEKGLLEEKADLNDPVTRFRFRRGLQKLR